LHCPYTSECRTARQLSAAIEYSIPFKTKRQDYKQSHKYLKRLNECHFERSREIFNEAPEDFSTSLEMTQPIYETASSANFGKPSDSLFRLAFDKDMTIVDNRLGKPIVYQYKKATSRVKSKEGLLILTTSGLINST